MTTEERVEILIRDEVLARQNGLVEDLLKSELVTFEDLEGYFVDASRMSAAECRAWLDDMGYSYPDNSNPWEMERDEIAEGLEALGIAVDDDEPLDVLRDALFDSLDAGDWGDVEDWRLAVNDNDEGQEIFEWWFVTPWLAEKLLSIGAPVLRTDYGDWWGRTETGQALSMDSALNQVAADLGRA